MLLRRAVTVTKFVEAAVCAVEPLLDKAGDVPRAVSIAIISSWIRLGCEASMMSTVFTLEVNVAVVITLDGNDATGNPFKL